MTMPRVRLPVDPRWAWAVLFLGRPVPSATVLRIPSKPRWIRRGAWVVPAALGFLGAWGWWWPESSYTCRRSQRSIADPAGRIQVGPRMKGGRDTAPSTTCDGSYTG
jgi:hypothetical protein